MYLDFTLFTLVGFTQFQVDIVPRGFSTVISVIVFVRHTKNFSLTIQPFLLGAIPYIYSILKKKKSVLINDKCEEAEQINSLTEGVNPERAWSLNFVIFYMIRRVFFALLFVFPS